MIHERRELYFIKILNFSSVKDTINRMKRQATIWEKVFTIHISEKRIVSKIYF